MTRTTNFPQTPELRRFLLCGVALVVSILLAACQQASVVAPGASVTSVQVQGATDQVRQGHGLVTIEVVGEHLADIALAKLGSLGGAVTANNDSSATIEFDIPHGADLGPHALTLTTAAGPVAVAAAVTITPITAGPAGHDVAGTGTEEDPYRTLAHALTIAQPGDTVLLLDGIYTAAGGEVWPTLVPAGVTIRGQSRSGTLLDGDLAGVHGLILQDGSAVAELSLTGFDAGLGMLDGEGSIENVRAYQNVIAGLFGTNTAALHVTGGRFDQNTIGIRLHGTASLTMTAAQVDHNGSAGVLVTNAADLTDGGSDLSDNAYGVVVGVNGEAHLVGSVVGGNTSFGLWVLQDAVATVQEGSVDGNLYGVVVSNNGEILFEGGSASHNLRDGFFFDHASSATLEGVEIHDNDDDKLGGVCFSGVAAFTSGQIRLRDTSFQDNCFGIYVAGEASVFDLGTAVDPGGNSFVDSANFHLFDARPALAGPTGTVITLFGTHFGGVEPSGGMKTGVDQQVVGPNKMWRIDQAHQRIEFAP